MNSPNAPETTSHLSKETKIVIDELEFRTRAANNTIHANQERVPNGVASTYLSRPHANGYSLAWGNITYTVPVSRLPWNREKKTLLQSITGQVDKGGVMALMGPSGSGKTTLLDILADRVSSGEITGEILINGIPRNEEVSPQSSFFAFFFFLTFCTFEKFW